MAATTEGDEEANDDELLLDIARRGSDAGEKDGGDGRKESVRGGDGLSEYDYPTAPELLIGKRTTPADLHSSMARAMRRSIILSVKRQLEVIARAKLSRFDKPTDTHVLEYVGNHQTTESDQPPTLETNRRE